MQAFLFLSFFFSFSCLQAKRETSSQAFLADSVEPGDKNGGVTKAMQRKLRKY